MKITGEQLAKAINTYLYVGDSAIFNTGNVDETEFAAPDMPGYAVLALVKNLLDKVVEAVKSVDDVEISPEMQAEIDQAREDGDYDLDDEDEENDPLDQVANLNFHNIEGFKGDMDKIFQPAIPIDTHEPKLYIAYQMDSSGCEERPCFLPVSADLNWLKKECEKNFEEYLADAEMPDWGDVGDGSWHLSDEDGYVNFWIQPLEFANTIRLQKN